MEVHISVEVDSTCSVKPSGVSLTYLGWDECELPVCEVKPNLIDVLHIPIINLDTQVITPEYCRYLVETIATAL